MEPQVTQFNGRVFVMVPDHIEDVVVLRKTEHFQFTLPKDQRRHYAEKLGIVKEND